MSLTYIRNFIQLLFIPTSYGFPTARGKARAFPQLVGYGFSAARGKARAFPQLVGYGFPAARSEARAFPQLVGCGFPGIFEENISSTTRVWTNKTFKK